ncbi:MAG: metal transporter [Casimicrobiaceae bacterium]
MLAVAALLATWNFVHNQTQVEKQATETPAVAPSKVATVDGVTIVTIDPAIQLQSGIKTATVSASTHRTEVTAYGVVMDLQPLIDLRIRYTAAAADVQTAQIAADASRHEYERNRTLYQDNQNVSLKAFQGAQATFLSDHARVEAASLNAKNILGIAQQQFGEPLARWAMDPDSRQFQKLLSREQVLLRIVLPLDWNTSAPPAIEVEANNQQRVPAVLVSRSPQGGPSIPGNPFFYQSAVPFAAGTTLVAYLPTSNAVTQGIFIPANAIVWYGGQPWAYVQIAPDRFARRAVPQQSPSAGGFFITEGTEGIKPGQRIVVSGAELLHSEEMRPPPNSPACKDPECD